MNNKIIKSFPIFVLVAGVSLFNASMASEQHVFQIKVDVNTGVLLRAGILAPMDHDAENETTNLGHAELAHAGDLSLLIKDKSTGTVIDRIYSDSMLPTFSYSRVYKTNNDFLNIEVVLNDRDYELINPYSWFYKDDGTGTTDDQTSIVSQSINPNQNDAVSSYSYTNSYTTRILTNSSNQIKMTKSDKDGKILENRTVTTVDEYQNIISSESALGYSVSLQKIR